MVKNIERWTATKYRFENGSGRVGADVGPGSRLAADLIAQAYGINIPRYAGGALADLGCGQVPLYGFYRDYVEEIVCVDWPSSKHELNHLDVACDLTQPLPFDGGSFETVVLSDVFEHIPEPAALWQEVGRVVAPGGYVLVTVPFFYWLHEQPHDYYRYTEHALRRLAERSGLEVERLEALGGSVEVFVDLVSKHLSVVPVVGRWAARLLQAVAIWWSRRGPGRALIRLTGERFPLAYLLVARRAE